MKTNNFGSLEIMNLESTDLERGQFKESQESLQRRNEFQEEIVWKCFNCGKELRYNIGDLYVGGHPTQGWVKVHIERHGTSLNDIKLWREKSDFTFCSIKCMKEYSDYCAP